MNDSLCFLENHYMFGMSFLDLNISKLELI